MRGKRRWPGRRAAISRRLPRLCASTRAWCLVSRIISCETGRWPKSWRRRCFSIYKNLRAIQSSSHLVYWLRKVASHRCIDQARRQKLRPRLSLTEYLERAPEPASRGPVSDPLLAGVLRRLVARLAERSRMIVILRFQEDLEPAEIAEMLGIPLGTVKSNLHRSLALLRARLERERKGVAR